MKNPPPVPEGPLIEHVADRVAAIRRQQLKALQLKLFPDWPNDRRGAPNTVIRSAVFGVVRRGRRKRVTDMPVAGPAGRRDGTVSSGVLRERRRAYQASKQVAFFDDSASGSWHWRPHRIDLIGAGRGSIAGRVL